MIDNRVLSQVSWEKKSKEKPRASDAIIEGDLNFKRTTPPEILGTILPLLGLAFSVQNDFVWFSSPENIRNQSFEALETRYYDLNNFMSKDWKYSDESFRIQYAARLGALMPSIYEPETGKELTFYFYNHTTERLVVHQTPSNHAKLQMWLKRLYPHE